VLEVLVLEEKQTAGRNDNCALGILVPRWESWGHSRRADRGRLKDRQTGGYRGEKLERREERGVEGERIYDQGWREETVKVRCEVNKMTKEAVVATATVVEGAAAEEETERKLKMD
jgi:hypothetical protein